MLEENDIVRSLNRFGYRLMSEDSRSIVFQHERYPVRQMVYDIEEKRIRGRMITQTSLLTDKIPCPDALPFAIGQIEVHMLKMISDCDMRTYEIVRDTVMILRVHLASTGRYDQHTSQLLDNLLKKIRPEGATL